MRPPVTALPAQIDEIPDRAAVFLLWAAGGAPYLARTALLRRRLRRLLSREERLSRVLRLGGVAERIEYWPVGSQLEAMLVHLELAQRYFPEDWRKITRLQPPAFVRLSLHNPFPRTMVTTRLGRGLFHGPFPSRAAAARFEAEVLDLFQLRRCEENLSPSPQHPGCIYGEMNRCLRPCQEAVSRAEYAHEAARVEQFLRTSGASLAEAAEAARDRASAAMEFEEAERLHQRLVRIREAAAGAGELARTLDRLHGVAIAPSAEPAAVELLILAGGRWLEPRRLALSDTAGAGQPLDHRLRALLEGVEGGGPPDPEHLAILMRWHQSSWRVGEWIGFDSFGKIPYRRLVNAVGRVAAAPGVH
jgi:excinuclease ABC subunit C